MKNGSRSKKETKTYQKWFNLADSDGDGRISGNKATKFFALSNLSRSQLKQLWTFANVKRQWFFGFPDWFRWRNQGKNLTQIFSKFKLTDKENIKPPILEGLDALVAQKSLTITTAPEINGIAQPQVFPIKCFGSKSSEKSGPNERRFLEISLLLMLICLSVALQHIAVDADMPFGGLTMA